MGAFANEGDSDQPQLLQSEPMGHIETIRQTRQIASTKHDVPFIGRLANSNFTNDLNVPPHVELDLDGFVSELADLSEVIFDPFIRTSAPTPLVYPQTMFVDGTKLYGAVIDASLTATSPIIDMNVYAYPENGSVDFYCGAQEGNSTLPCLVQEQMFTPTGRMVVNQYQNLYRVSG